jgi:hypothetical protein
MSLCDQDNIMVSFLHGTVVSSQLKGLMEMFLTMSFRKGDAASKWSS